MTTIRNKFDHTGMGMFSKTGRFTSEKFYILRKKDEILKVKNKTLKVPLFTASTQIVTMPANILERRFERNKPAAQQHCLD